MIPMVVRGLVPVLVFAIASYGAAFTWRSVDGNAKRYLAAARTPTAQTKQSARCEALKQKAFAAKALVSTEVVKGDVTKRVKDECTGAILKKASRSKPTNKLTINDYECSVGEHATIYLTSKGATVFSTANENIEPKFCKTIICQEGECSPAKLTKGVRPGDLNKYLKKTLDEAKEKAATLSEEKANIEAEGAGIFNWPEEKEQELKEAQNAVNKQESLLQQIKELTQTEGADSGGLAPADAGAIKKSESLGDTKKLGVGEPIKVGPKGQVDPVDFTRKAAEKFAEIDPSSWPRKTLDDFKKMGIKDPSDPYEVAKGLAKLTQQESNFNAFLKNPRENSIGALQWGIGDAPGGKKLTLSDVRNPDNSIDAFMRSAKEGTLSSYFGPLKRGGSEVRQHEDWYNAHVAPYLSSNLPSAPATPSYQSSGAEFKTFPGSGSLADIQPSGSAWYNQISDWTSRAWEWPTTQASPDIFSGTDQPPTSQPNWYAPIVNAWNKFTTPSELSPIARGESRSVANVDPNSPRVSRGADTVPDLGYDVTPPQDFTPDSPTASSDILPPYWKELQAAELRVAEARAVIQAFQRNYIAQDTVASARADLAQAEAYRDRVKSRIAHDDFPESATEQSPPAPSPSYFAQAWKDAWGAMQDWAARTGPFTQTSPQSGDESGSITAFLSQDNLEKSVASVDPAPPQAPFADLGYATDQAQPADYLSEGVVGLSQPDYQSEGIVGLSRPPLERYFPDSPTTDSFDAFPPNWRELQAAELRVAEARANVDANKRDYGSILHVADLLGITQDPAATARADLAKAEAYRDSVKSLVSAEFPEEATEQRSPLSLQPTDYQSEGIVGLSKPDSFPEEATEQRPPKSLLAPPSLKLPAKKPPSTVPPPTTPPPETPPPATPTPTPPSTTPPPGGGGAPPPGGGGQPPPQSPFQPQPPQQPCSILGSFFGNCQQLSCKLQAAGPTIAQGSGVTIWWEAPGATTAYISGIGQVSLTNTSMSVYPPQTMTYTMEVFDQTGNRSSCQTTVNVQPLRPPQPPQPQAPHGRGTDGSACPQPQQQPSSGSCTGILQPLKANNGCLVGWQCMSGTSGGVQSLSAELSCAPKRAEIGNTIAITFACRSAATTRGEGFETSGKLEGEATARVTSSEDSKNATSVTYTLICTDANGKTATEKCVVQINKSSIVLVANPKEVSSGEASHIGWTTIGMNSCTLASKQLPAFTEEQKVNLKTSGVVKTPSLTQKTDFVLSCITKAGGTKAATTTVVIK